MPCPPIKSALRTLTQLLRQPTIFRFPKACHALATPFTLLNDYKQRLLQELVGH